MRASERFAAIAILLAAATAVGNVLVAQTGRPQQRQAQSGGTGNRAPQDLVARAVAQGRVRVIVGLNVAMVPEGNLSPPAAAAQRNRIAQAQAQVLGDLAAFNFGRVKRFRIIPGMALEADLAGLDVLATHPLVAYLQEDVLLRPTLAESTVIIGAPTVWAGGNTGSTQAVAILDTGVDKAHSFMGGRVVSEACYSSNVPANSSTTVCPGGVEESTATGSGVPCPFVAPSSSDCFHGTHVAGIAAGSGATFHGVARGAGIIAIQVFSRFDDQGICGGAALTPCALSWTSDQVLGLQRAFELRTSFNVAAANMSLGGGPVTNQATCDANAASTKAAIDQLRSVGIATVIASGNSGATNGISSPGCISSAVSVGSTRDGSNGAVPVDTVSSFSNSASFLNLLAPGQWINSSIPGGGFAIFQGTSMAAPHVTGAWALMKQAVPSASVTDVLNAFVSTGAPIFDTRNGITKPRINLPAAINALVTSTGPDGGGNTVNGNTTNPDIPSGFGIDEEVITVPAYAFKPRDSATSFTSDAATGIWVTGGPSFLYASMPRVPNGADITQVLFYVSDLDGSTDFVGRLCRHWVDSNTGLNAASDCPVNIKTNGTGTMIWADFVPRLLYRADVDNDATVENVSYTLSGGFGTATAGTIRLRHARILFKREVSAAPGFATFSDVPVGNPFHRFVEALVDSGVTGGCGGGMYCPNGVVTRGQMAVFLSSALGLHWPAF